MDDDKDLNLDDEKFPEGEGEEFDAVGEDLDLGDDDLDGAVDFESEDLGDDF